MKKLFLSVATLALVAPGIAAADQAIKPYFLNDNGNGSIIDSLSGSSVAVPSGRTFSAPAAKHMTTLTKGFEGTSDYDTRALGIGLIPPDTMGAVGRSQYVEIINGSFTVYNKSTGALAAPRVTDSAFWTAAGGQATGGDPRILYNKAANRWIATGFNASDNGLQIAVSTTGDALGPWKAAQFATFNDPGRFNGIADYGTLAISGQSILVGTNDFSAATSTGARSFRGTTLNVLSLKDVLKSGGPDVSGAKQFLNPFVGDATVDRGFVLQGANRTGGSSTATVVAASLFTSDNVTYSITNAGKATSAQTDRTYLNGSGFNSPSAARQPTTGLSARVLDAGDERIGSNAWEYKGRVYFATTVMQTGTDHDVVRVTVFDKASNKILSETDIGGGPSDHFDYYYGSLTLNSAGQVVVGYNRSGDVSTGVDGRASIFARSFNSNADGTLKATSGEILIKQSLVDNYHNGSPESGAPAGRQRFGDYASVTLDPNDSHHFWVVGEFAREFNTLANHPGGSGSGFGRWGTYIGQIDVASVPEPASWAMMIGGFGMIGLIRRQRRTVVAA